MKSKLKIKIITLIGTGLIIGMFLIPNIIQNITPSNNFRLNNENSLNNLQISENDYQFDLNSFNATGKSLNVSLFSTRNESFSKTISEGGIVIENQKENWNMTDFTLNFTDISAKETSVNFETRNDGSLNFKGNNISYASSFQIPNTCKVNNLSMFLQYPGGEYNMGNKDSLFNITIYNSSENLTPDSPINTATDEIQFDLTDKIVSQPARWYQANFTERLLNISDTYNNTFFVVFESIKFPAGFFGSPDAYIYYAQEEPTDEYEILFYNKNSGETTWNNLNGKNGMFKVGFVPIKANPTPNQINLTVFSTQIESKLYENSTFFPHKENQFYIPISSPWFGEIEYRVDFKGNFQYNTKSLSSFATTANSVVFWNLTLENNFFEANSYNHSARFDKPKFWRYMSTWNGREIYSDTNVHTNFTYAKILNISNGNWTVAFNQSNNIIESAYYSSENKSDWLEFNTQVDAYKYINI
ncbi:MAG: hypothetical protein EU547_07505, partial [Promethearchaeota archaeon]